MNKPSGLSDEPPEPIGSVISREEVRAAGIADPEPSPREVEIVREAARQVGGMRRLRNLVNSMIFE